jgi:hydrogenase-4 component G
MESIMGSRMLGISTATHIKSKDGDTKKSDLKDTINDARSDAAKNIEKMKEAYSNIDIKELTNSYFAYYQNQTSQNSSLNFTAQFSAFSFSNITDSFSNSKKTVDQISDILSSINIADTGYTGKSITNLSQKEAAELVSDKGYFGIDNTANRISGFVINGAGDNLDKLKAGREGIQRGYEQAKKAWGGNLPEISEKTMTKALEAIDKHIVKLGGSVVDVKA